MHEDILAATDRHVVDLLTWPSQHKWLLWRLICTRTGVVHGHAPEEVIMAHLYEDDWGAIKALGDSADLRCIVVLLHLVLHGLHTQSTGLTRHKMAMMHASVLNSPASVNGNFSSAWTSRQHVVNELGKHTGLKLTIFCLREQGVLCQHV